MDAPIPLDAPVTIATLSLSLLMLLALPHMPLRCVRGGAGCGRPRAPRSDVREGRRRRVEHLVPRAGETPLLAVTRERSLLLPLTARKLVIDFETVTVGIREVNADRDRVIADGDGDAFVLQAPEDLREVV